MSAAGTVTSVTDWPLLVAAHDASAALTTAVCSALRASVAFTVEAPAQITPPFAVGLKAETLVAPWRAPARRRPALAVAARRQ